MTFGQRKKGRKEKGQCKWLCFSSLVHDIYQHLGKFYYMHSCFLERVVGLFVEKAIEKILNFLIAYRVYVNSYSFNAIKHL
jgi:hypothetical protein